ncbi:MAG TPA: TonB-dependent receptor [Terracidiphilus sp.]|nr:TonB-dependent receptor [Terracidiphilus sp.]
MRFLVCALAFLLFAPIAALACTTATLAPPPSPGLHGVVAAANGAVIPNAEVDLVDATGATVGKFQSGADGAFQVTAPHTGAYTLVISAEGFKTVQTAVTLAAASVSAASTQAAVKLAAPTRVIMAVAPAATTNIVVNAETSVDLTSTDENHDSSVMTAHDLKSLPIFDNDFVSAMGSFLDSDVAATGGSGLMVDGVEANRVTVSASAVQEVRINQDPYSARYYYPGRGQMEIVTKSAAQAYHGEFNFYFRDSAMNAQNALAPSKPFEQRRIYEGSTTGPIPRSRNSGFLISFNRAEEDLDSVVSASILPTVSNPSGAFSANVPAPTRDTEFSIRASHQFGMNSAYVQYSFQNWTGQNQGVGGQSLAASGYNSQYREDDVTAHVDSALSATTLNQLSLVAEHTGNRTQNAAEAPRIGIPGYFYGGSAQNDSFGTEYNARLSDIVTWTHGRNLVKYGIGIPHMGRRAFDDETNELGSYTFGPTLAADGVTVLESALQNYAANLPSAYSLNTGDTHFIYHQQEVGAFVQDQIKISNRFAINPGLRYDWQNFLAARRLGFSPRISFAWVLDPDEKMIVRGGGGIYYDRFGGGPLLDLERYSNARRRSIVLSFNPASLPQSGCVPITDCMAISAQPPNIVSLEPDAKIPYQIHYGLSIERQLGEKATGTVSVYSMRGIDMFRSVDINAPTPESSYSERPDPNYGRIREMQPAGFYEGNGLDISYRGRWNKYFTGFGRYTWSHYAANTGGIYWFPQNQYDPGDEWSNSNWDRRQRVGMYAIFDQKSLLNIAAGVFANTGTPWTVLTGSDPYGDGLFNARPDGVARNTETGPGYVDVDLRWGHDFAITANKDDEAPRLGFSASAYNVVNHVNGSGIDNVETSSSFGDITSVGAPRRIQLAMRFQF